MENKSKSAKSKSEIVISLLRCLTAEELSCEAKLPSFPSGAYRNCMVGGHPLLSALYFSLLYIVDDIGIIAF